SGTSPALPIPKPTVPFPSPTTTSAENLKIRPPFTVLETRLIATTRSFISIAEASILAKSIPPYSELEAALAGAFAQLFDAAVEDITAAVEHNLGDSFIGSALGQQFANLMRGFFVTAVSFEFCIQGGGSAQRHSCNIVDNLGVDVLVGAEHIQAGTGSGARN